jgi:S4 domain
VLDVKESILFKISIVPRGQKLQNVKCSMLGYSLIRHIRLKVLLPSVAVSTLSVGRYKHVPLPLRCAPESDTISESGTPKVQKKGKKQRLDDICLSLFPEHSKAKIQSWIALGKVLVNDKVVLKSGTPVPSTANVVITAVEQKYVCR